MTSDPFKLAYFAGYIDGDGHIQLRQSETKKGTKFSSCLIINTVDKENALWFMENIGGNITLNRSSRPRHKPIYRYILSGKEFEKLDLQPFLVERKAEFEIFQRFRKSFSKSLKKQFVKEIKDIRTSYLITDSIKQELNTVKNTVKPSPVDFAYLAGFIDAECCLGIQRNFPKNRPNPTYKIQLHLNDTKSPMFYWLSRRFGGQFHFIDRSKLKTPCKNQMGWRLSAAQLSSILPRIQPFLQHKKPVCEALIKFQDLCFIRKGSPSTRSPQFTEFYRPILEEKAQIFDHVTCLNKGI